MNVLEIPAMVARIGEAVTELDGKIRPILATYKPNDLLTIAYAQMAQYTLDLALKAGPTEHLAERLKVSPEQAATLYKLVLTDALRRS